MRERSRDQIQMGDGLGSRRAPPRTATEKTCGVWKLSGSGLAGSVVAKTMRPPGVDAALTAPTRISPPRHAPSTTRATRVSNADRTSTLITRCVPPGGIEVPSVGRDLPKVTAVCVGDVEVADRAEPGTS